MCLIGGQKTQKHSAGPAQVFLLERCQHTEVKLFGATLSIFFFSLPQLDMTFHLFVCALAGAGAAVVAMVRKET